MRYARASLLASILGLGLLGCRAESPDTSPSSLVVRPDGIGAIRAGMTLAEAARALGEPLRAAYDMFDACDHVRPTGLPAGVQLMVIRDTVARVEVDTSGTLTAAGIGVGDPIARVLAAYDGYVRVEPHPYDAPDGQFLIVDSPEDPRFRMIFETDGARVVRYRAGLRGPVDQIEGCA